MFLDFFYFKLEIIILKCNKNINNVINLEWHFLNTIYLINLYNFMFLILYVYN